MTGNLNGLGAGLLASESPRLELELGCPQPARRARPGARATVGPLEGPSDGGSHCPALCDVIMRRLGPHTVRVPVGLSESQHSLNSVPVNWLAAAASAARRRPATAGSTVNAGPEAPDRRPHRAPLTGSWKPEAAT